MPDVVFLSSVFGEVKLAEPMGVCILTAALRECGITVQIVEPSIEGLTEDESAEIVCSIDAPIVALSVLRDKHVDVVLRFTRILRRKCPERFVILGGHGPSIAVNDIEDSHHVWQWVAEEASMQEPIQLNNSVKDSFNDYGLLPNTGPIVDHNLVDRGKGPGDISSDGAATIARSGPSIYYNRSAEYIKILANIDTYMIGESDSNLPILVKKVLANDDWRDIPGLAYLNESNHLVKTPLPPKIRENDALRTWLSPSLVLLDFCIILGHRRNGELCVTSEISPDSMRIRTRDSRSMDKDLFRRGKTAEQIIVSWTKLIELVQHV